MEASKRQQTYSKTFAAQTTTPPKQLKSLNEKISKEIKKKCSSTFFPSVHKILFTSKSPRLQRLFPLGLCPSSPAKSALRPRPSSSRASTAAPAARSCSATEPWPLNAAQNSGVMPQGGQGNGSGRSPGPWRIFASEVFQWKKTCSMTICRTWASEIIRNDFEGNETGNKWQLQRGTGIRST